MESPEIRSDWSARRVWLDLAVATGITASAAAVAMVAERLIGLASPALILVTGVVLSALRASRPAALCSATLSFLAYDFLFVDPRFSFSIARPDEIVAVATFLVVALIVGGLAARLRAQVDVLHLTNSYSRALAELRRRLATAGDEQAACTATAQALRDAVGAEVLVVQAGSEPAPTGSGWTVAPCTPELSLAVRIRPAAELPGARERLSIEMIEDLAKTLERVRLSADLELARLEAETERLRAALLSSVSHDLRSPLAGMIGAATSLAAYGDAISGGDRRALLDSILEEGQRLDRYIQNLLDMTRLGHGPLKLVRDWIGADDIIAAAVSRLRRLVPDVSIAVAVPSELPLLNVHPALVEQALFNVLENASKFSPAGTAVRIEAYQDAAWLVIDVLDRGPGIPPEARERIFDPFYSVTRGDCSGNGTGLGLAICRGMINAHGGSVQALAPASGVGTLMRIRLPLEAAPEAESEGA
jgi:two-component system sensor histidine kinase KdpD